MRASASRTCCPTFFSEKWLSEKLRKGASLCSACVRCLQVVQQGQAIALAGACTSAGPHFVAWHVACLMLPGGPPHGSDNSGSDPGGTMPHHECAAASHRAR